MKRFYVSVQCMAYYNSHIDVPDDWTDAQAIQYANEHLEDIEIMSPVEYISDSDVLDEENCYFGDDEI